MVKADFISFLKTTLVSLAAKYGVPSLPPIEQEVDNLVVLNFNKQLANEYSDQISSMVDEIEKLDGVSEVCDFKRDIILRGNEKRMVEIGVRRKHWYMSEADRAHWKEYELLMDGDPGAEARVKAKEDAERTERRKYYKEFLIPIPPPSPTKPTELYLTMAYEPYDQIVAGEKVTEFRIYCETWVKRILANLGTLKTVKFQRGYGGPGRPKPEQMIWTIRNIELYDIETRESSDPINVKEGFLPTHIAIDLGVRMDNTGPVTQKDK